jgi:hypothetical protein
MADSICSTMSSMTVSAFGQDDMDLEAALDHVFIDLQTFVNGCHCEVRGLAMCEDRADTYIEAAKLWRELDRDITGALFLFKELRSITKQLLGSCPKEYKQEFAELKKSWKDADDREKEVAKEAAKTKKEEAKASS